MENEKLQKSLSVYPVRPEDMVLPVILAAIKKSLSFGVSFINSVKQGQEEVVG